MKLNVKLENLDDELFYKRLAIRVGSKEIVTPVKASDKKNPISYINEIYKRFKLDKINKCLSDESQERIANIELKRLRTSGINFFIVDYPELKTPNDEQIGFLSDIQYSYSDLVITPTWSKITRTLTGEDLLSSFLSLTNKFYDIIQTLNHKSIIGLIPSNMPRQFLEPIIKNYIDKDITSYIIDFQGSSVSSKPSWIRQLLRLINDNALLESSFIYSTNAYKATFSKKANEVLAKDFMSLGFGIDILGNNHMPTGFTQKASNELKSRETRRIFDRSSYGYKTLTLKELNKIGLPTERKLLDNLSLKNQFDESIVLQERLKETHSLKPYIEGKTQVTNNVITDIQKVRKETFEPDQPEISDFFQ